MKKDTKELMNTITSVVGESSKTLPYQSVLPRMISSIVLSKLTGNENVAAK
jgi:hypothetical protein